MRSKIVLSLAAVLALSACNSADKPKSPDEVQDEIAQMTKPQPGLYRSTSTLVSLEMPGAPAEAVEAMRRMFSAQGGQEFCLTQAEADKGYEEMTRKLAQGNCTYDRFNANAGSLDAKLTCEVAEGARAVIEMQGTVSETGSKMTMRVNQSAPGMPAGGMTMVANVSSERVGDCPG